MARRFATSSLFHSCFLAVLVAVLSAGVARAQLTNVTLVSDHTPPPASNTSMLGESVQFRVTVTDNSAPPVGFTPTGWVTISESVMVEGSPVSVVLGRSALNGSALAVFSTSLLRVGTHSLSAHYEGDGNFNPNDSSALTHTVNGSRAVTVSVGLSPGSVGVGAPSTVSVGVTDDAANPGPSGVKGAFAPIAPLYMTAARTGHTATLLPSGKVFIAGGRDASGGLSDTEIFDPVTGFSPGPPLPGGARVGHSATLLHDGRVLIVGGSTSDMAADVITTNTAAIYDPVAGTITLVGGSGHNLHYPRMKHTATLLPDGRVLIAGGTNASNAAIGTTELFALSTPHFSDGPSLSAPRSGHSATLLSTGVILMAGGNAAGSAQIYTLNAAGTAWLSTLSVGQLNTARTSHTATLLLDGNVLLTGGSNVAGLSSTELYEVRSGAEAFAAITTVLDRARSGHTATFLNDGRILVLGGIDDTTPSPVILDSGLLYTPSFDPQGTAGLASDHGGATPNDTITPSCVLALSGNGTTTCAGSITPGNATTPHVITASYADYVSDAVHAANSNTGSLGVTKGTPVITWANPAAIAYGTPLNTTDHLNATLSVPGTPVYSPVAGTILLPGVGHVLHVDFTPDDTVNYDAVSKNVTIDVNLKQLTISGVTANNKPYDGNTTVALNTATAALAGVVGSDVVTLDSSGATASFADRAAGNNKPVAVSGFTIGGANASYYTLQQPAGVTADITAKDLTIVGATAGDKVYDGNSSATLNTAAAAFVGIIAPDVVTLDASGATGEFNNKTVGAAKPVATSGFVAGGADAGNYHVVQPTASASISALAITGHITAANKVYDGDTTATISGRSLTGAIPGDVVSYSGGTATFADKVVGNGKTVSATGLTLSGSDAGNYTVNGSATSTANITPLGITANVTVANKVYDGNKNASITGCAPVGVVAGDTVTCNGSAATFSDKNIGAGKTVTITGVSLSGADAGNYSVPGTATTTADITGVPVVGSITVSNKTYDGTTAATISTRSLTGVLPGDDVTYAGGAATFADKNVAAGKTVNATGLSLTGADAGNYTVNSTATATASITPATLTVTAAGINKVYDGNTSASVTLADDRFGTDALTTSYTTAAFSDKSVGASKTVSVGGIAITGADAANYTGNTTTTTTASITSLAITGHVTVSDKVYDATTSATITARSLTGVLSGDTVSLTGGTATFNTKDVGSGKTVTATGLSLSGTDAVNYSASSTVATTASITPAPTTTNLSGAVAVTRDGKYQVSAKVTWQFSTESPAGTVTFTDNGASLQTMALDSSGQATFGPILVPLAAGQHSIKASYTPDANLGKNFGASESVMAVTVTPPVSTQPGRVVLQTAAVTAASSVSLVQCRVDSLAPVAPPTTLFPACDVDPKSLPSGGSTLTVKVQTVSGSSTALRPQRMFYAMWLGVAGVVWLPFAGLAAGRRRTLAWLGLMLIIALCVGAVACGGGFGNPKGLLPSVGGPGATQPGQYVVVVSGVDAGLKPVVVASVPVNVQY